jgi:GGDEF domain-containing protein
MDPNPLIVDRSTPVEELSKLVIHKGKATFTDGFIITENGHYLGLGSGYDLMEVIMQLQIAAARYSNPLTLLPGNVPISNHIQQFLDDRTPFCAAYCDLDNFKPFNDIYGYDRGDEIILLLSGILKDEVDTSRDFLGHIGGDDFFILFRSEDWEQRCHAILNQFASASRRCFQQRHLADGGYFSEDRCGRTVFHPLPSLSIGAVTVNPDGYHSHHEVAGAASVAKKQAKKISGNSLFAERRQAQQTDVGPQAEAA